jgi:hypothetical protein
MKKITPGIGNRAKRYRKPAKNLVGSGKKIKKRKTSQPRRKNGRKRNKRKTKKRR